MQRENEVTKRKQRKSRKTKITDISKKTFIQFLIHITFVTKKGKIKS